MLLIDAVLPATFVRLLAQLFQRVQLLVDDPLFRGHFLSTGRPDVGSWEGHPLHEAEEVSDWGDLRLHPSRQLYPMQDEACMVEWPQLAEAG